MPDAMLQEPVAVFLTIMAVILITPLLTQRVRLPGIVGLILGGMLVGPHVLNLLATGRTIELLSSVGLIYLMFSAGLELDLNQFARVRGRAFAFGALTFTIPQVLGIGLGRLLGLDWPASVLLGSTFASHTLLAFPIVSHLRIMRNEAVAVTIGATVFTDVGALLVLAIVAAAQGGDVSTGYLVRLLALLAGYSALILVGLPRLGKLFFGRYTAHSVEFQFVLVALFVSAMLAELIGMHAIVGAFLAGLAINYTLPARSIVVNQVLFLGESFFIPVFLMYVGMIIDPLAVVSNLGVLVAGLALTVSVYSTKFVAAWLAGRLFHYSRDELFTMWGLSQAQAAATLATILVGLQLGIFPSTVFDGAILMVLFTCVTSPLLVQRFGARLHAEPEPVEHVTPFDRVLVPIANPATQEHLINLASILVRVNDGVLLPLNVALDRGAQITGLQTQRELLSAEILQGADTQIKPIRRIDTSVSKGILRAAVENDASLIVMGWRGKPTLRQSILGTVLDEVVWSASVPVIVGRITTPINGMTRVILVVPAHSLSAALAHRAVEVVTTIAKAVNIPILVLTASAYHDSLSKMLNHGEAEYQAEVETLKGDVVREATKRAGAHDMIIVTSMGSQGRFRSGLGRIPERIATAISGSIVVIHYP